MMDVFDLEYFWRLVWWGLHSEKEIIDNFTRWEKGKRIENPTLKKTYKQFLEKKEALISDSKSNAFQKLDKAFYALNNQGILSIHYAGSTMSAGHTAVAETLDVLYKEVSKSKFEIDLSKIVGYCFYHEQDIEELVPSLDAKNIPQESFYLAFGALDESVSNIEIGKRITSVLETEELNFDWENDEESRILLSYFTWIKENDAINWTEKASEDILGLHRKNKKTHNSIIEIGQVVRIIEGPFNNFEGIVQEINLAENTLLVEVSIFGRKTPVEVTTSQVIGQ